MPNQELINAQA
jgi:hypothetical protein